MAEKFDVVVIGGGTAGLVTASGCARLGRRVALIEKHALGGDCLWTGCVPTKALVASAKLAHQMRTAERFGLERHEPKITPRSIMESMRAERHRIEHHDDPEKFRALGIDEIVVKEDAEVIARVRQLLADEGVKLNTGWGVKSVRVEGGKKIARIENKQAESREIAVDEIFVASGRRGNIDSLGLDAIGVT